MQTFLPYPDIQKSLACLDNKRLGKQRLEAYQLLRTLRGYTSGWRHHPAVRMWQGHEELLSEYYNTAIRLWKERGFKNTMEMMPVNGASSYPEWWGDERLHSSHRANLLRKDPGYYSQFGWTEDPDTPYYWPEGSNTED